MELQYRTYEQPAAGYVGWYEANNKVFAWVHEDGSLTYAVDLI